MARAYKSSSGRIIPRRSGGQFRRTTLQDFGISQSELSDGNMICANCGYGEGEEKWRPVLKTGYCPKCHSQEKKVCPTPRAADGAIEPIKCAECGDEIYPVCDACVGDMRHR